MCVALVTVLEIRRRSILLVGVTNVTIVAKLLHLLYHCGGERKKMFTSSSPCIFPVLSASRPFRSNTTGDIDSEFTTRDIFVRPERKKEMKVVFECSSLIGKKL